MSKPKTEAVYVSLVKNFINHYVKTEIGSEKFPTESDLRVYLNKHYRNWWCGVYYEDFSEVTKHDTGPSKAITFDQLDAMIIEQGLEEVTDNANKQYNKDYNGQ